MKPHNLIFTTLVSLTLISCATSPLGRKQLTVMPDSQMNSMGSQTFEEMKQKTPIQTDAGTNNYVKCVAGPITEAAKGQLQVDQWEIVVFRTADVNAFALPGGKIGVYTGILPLLKTDAQLAAVLGHEVGHVIARHGNERVSEGLGVNAALAVADLLTGKSSPKTKSMIMGGLGVGLQYGVMLPFSRTHESEADIIGLKLMAQAGFDPRQAAEVWKNMQAAKGAGNMPPEWASTHPSDQTRINNIEAHLPEVMPIYEAAQKAGKRPVCGRK